MLQSPSVLNLYEVSISKLNSAKRSYFIAVLYRLSMPNWLINRMVCRVVSFYLNVRCGGKYPLQDREPWLVRNFLVLFLPLDFLKRLRLDMPT